MDICEQVFNDLSYLARILKIVNPAVDITTIVASKDSDMDVGGGVGGGAVESRASPPGGAPGEGGFNMGETGPDQHLTSSGLDTSGASGNGIDVMSKSDVGVDGAVMPVSPEERQSSGGLTSEPAHTAHAIDPTFIDPTMQRHNAIRFLRELFYLTRSLPIDRRSDLYHRMLMQLGTQVNPQYLKLY